MARFETVIRNASGPVVPAATVSVFDANTTTLASLFSDPDLFNLIPNPTTSDALGIVGFYIASGTYDLLVQRFDIKDRTVEDVEI